MEKLQKAKYKEVIKKVIIQNQDRLRTLKIIPRAINLEQNGNYVFVGLRRVGKTYLLYQIIKAHYKIEDILFINFEDERLIEFSYKELDLLLEAYSELYKKKPLLFLDEIHNIKNWEKFVRRLADNDYKVMISGSNAKMLSADISTILGGRFFNHIVSPLSFSEFLNFNALELKENYEYSDQLFKLKDLYAAYLQYGGLPEISRYKNKREYLSGIYQKLFYGIGNNTLFEYINYLSESFMIHQISNFANKFVERETKKKYYFADTGLLGLFLINQDTKLLENQVFIELKRRYKEEVFYLKRKLEVDFYLPGQKLLIQVSYNMDDEDTRKRELKALSLAMEELNINKGFVITYDTEDQIEIKEKIIYIIPAWKWLLEE
ncbi:MAG: ATP-binding protein [Bacteroidetes bacterium 4572_77]|nr:MAG: ATP-binding protein [Bacteroidetes bacterium 4572_77]